MGAEVIKIEPPPVGDYMRDVGRLDTEVRASAGHLMLNRNKRSLTLNLRTEAGKEVFFSLLRTADAVFDLSVPGAREALGVDYEKCRQVKPDIVYVSLTGYGYNGPYAKFPSHGFGPAAFVGEARPVDKGDGRYDAEMRGGVSVPAGALFAGMALMSGLLHRALTGEGCYLETSLADAGVWWQHGRVFNHLNPYRPIHRSQTGAGAVRYNFYECADGKVVMLMPVEKKFWDRFCEAAGRDDLKGRGSWGYAVDFGTDDAELEREVIAIMRGRPRAEWLEILGRADVPVIPAFTIEELLAEEAHVAARQMVVRYDHPDLGPVALVSNPVKWPGHPFSVTFPAPEMGADNAEILASLGYAEADRERLKESGAIF
jgi:crotonobetainyl-CoA:carnitine CoA-transferase CaiB-like acyl-CoA transferase